MDDTQEAMDESAGYGNPFKRRRCNNNDSDHNAIVAANNGFSSSTVSTTSPFSRPGTFFMAVFVESYGVERLKCNDVTSIFHKSHWPME